MNAIVPTRDPRGRLSRLDIYSRLDGALAQLKRIGGLPSQVEARGIWGDIWYAEAHNSTAIEGNTLVRYSACGTASQCVRSNTSQAISPTVFPSTATRMSSTAARSIKLANLETR